VSRPIFVVFAKEVLENLRDRRVLLSAFFFGVLLAPLIFAFATTMLSKRTVREQDEALKLAVVGAARAPNLLQFLKENGTQIETVDYDAAAAMQAVTSGERDVVMIIPEDYAKRLSAGEPAPIDILFDSSNTSSGAASRATRLINVYGTQLAALRLLVRGVSQQTIDPIDIRSVDVATPAGRSLMILGMLTYFCLMSMLMGGFYLAIDTTAGERERGTLESLLGLPIRREALIAGKILATSTYMAVSLLLTLITFSIALRFVPLEALGMSANFGARVVAMIFFIMVSFVPVGAGLMTVVASFTRSNREAQTWLSLVLLIPLAPIMLAVVHSTRPTMGLMLVPSLSQHLLATALLRGDPIEPLQWLVSALSTMLVGAGFILLAMKLYRSEAILG
jgi:sodium transport system permease protein